jgi:hypothetical protein
MSDVTALIPPTLHRLARPSLAGGGKTAKGGSIRLRDGASTTARGMRLTPFARLSIPFALP